MSNRTMASLLSGLLLQVSTVFAADQPAKAAAVPPPIPAEDFVRVNQFSAPVLSPDGKHLVVTMRTKDGGRDVPLMVVYNLAEMKQVATVRLPGYEVPGGYTWASNRRLLVTTAREYGSREEPWPTGEILGMDLDGSKQEYLYGYNMYKRSKRGSTIRDDEGYGFITFVPQSLDNTFLLREQMWEGVLTSGQRSSLFQIDATNAARRLVVDIAMPHMSFLVQNDGKPRFAYGLDQTANFVLMRRDDVKNEWVRTHGAKAPEYLPIGFTADNQAFYATALTRPAEDGVAHGLMFLEQVADGERKTLAQIDGGAIDLIQRGPRPREPFAVGTSVGRPTLKYLDPSNPEAQLHQQLSQQFPNSFVSFVSFSSDGKKLLFRVSSDRDPGEYFLMDRQSMRAERLFASMSWIDPSRMGERRPISFKARDGLQLHGYITLPAKSSGGTLPLVLLPHGGPHGLEDDWFFDTDAQFLASRGYAVLQVNYRGSGGRGRDFVERGYRVWGTKVQEDLIDGVKWAVVQKLADPARVCVFGASFGAYSAMMTSIREPGMFKCAVGYAGLYDLGRWYNEDEVKRIKVSGAYLAKVIGSDPEEHARNSPVQLASKINVPVMLVHGEKDSVTLPEQAEAMHAALNKAGKAHEWIMVPDEGHGFYAEKNRLMFYQRLEAFLAKHLGP